MDLRTRRNQRQQSTQAKQHPHRTLFSRVSGAPPAINARPREGGQQIHAQDGSECVHDSREIRRKFPDPDNFHPHAGEPGGEQERQQFGTARGRIRVLACRRCSLNSCGSRGRLAKRECGGGKCDQHIQDRPGRECPMKSPSLDNQQRNGRSCHGSENIR